MRAKVGLLLIAVHAWDRFSLLYLLEGPSKMHEAMCVNTLTHQEPHPSWPQDLLIDPPVTKVSSHATSVRSTRMKRPTSL